MSSNSKIRNGLSAAACAITIVFGASTLLLGTFPLLLLPVCAELGWSRGLFSSALGIVGIVAAIGNPLIGRGVDRRGVRKFVLPGLLLYAVGLMALSRLTASTLRMYLLFAFAALASQACGIVPISKVISATFHKTRGLMLAFLIGGSMVVGMGGSVPITRLIVLTYGWRDVYLFSGLAVLFINFPLALAFLREPRTTGMSGEVPIDQLPGATLREAVSSSNFWIIIGSALLMAIAISGFNAHSFAWLTGRGVSGALATTLVAIIPFVGFVGQSITGFLQDRVSTPKIIIPILTTSIVGMIAMQLAGRAAILFTAALILGLGFNIPGFVYFVSRYFGLRSFSEIMGYYNTASLVGTAAGPFLMGTAFDRLGSYSPAIIGCEILLAVGAFMVMLLGPYVYPASHETPEPVSEQAVGTARN